MATCNSNRTQVQTVCLVLQNIHTEKYSFEKQDCLSWAQCECCLWLCRCTSRLSTTLQIAFFFLSLSPGYCALAYHRFYSVIQPAAWNKVSQPLASLLFLIPASDPTSGQRTPFLDSNQSCERSGEHDALTYSVTYAPVWPLKVNLLLCYKWDLHHSNLLWETERK